MSRSSHLSAVPPGYTETSPGVYAKQVTIGAALPVTHDQPPAGYAGEALEACRAAKGATEKALQAACESRLRAAGVRRPFHLSYRAREAVGFPDLVFCHRNIPYAVELKRPNKLPRASQIEYLADMHADGWYCCVAWSVEDFDALLATADGPARDRWLRLYGEYQSGLAGH